jgi:hypothetical protein
MIITRLPFTIIRSLPIFSIAGIARIDRLIIDVFPFKWRIILNYWARTTFLASAGRFTARLFTSGTTTGTGTGFFPIITATALIINISIASGGTIAGTTISGFATAGIGRPTGAGAAGFLVLITRSAGRAGIIVTA